MKAFLLLATTLLLTSCWHCQDETLIELPSPNGKYTAKVGKYGCDANTGLYGRIDVLVPGPAPNPNLAQCGDPGTSIASAKFGNDQSVSIKWVSDRELIARVRGGNPERKATQDVACINDRSVRILIEQ